MMRSLFSAVSGLKAHQQRMDVIGNNIANVNTPGFKKSRVTFQDMLNQTIRGASRPIEGGRGGTNPMQMGLGVTIGSIDTDFGATSLQDTGKNTDLGINGDGFFILAEKAGGREFYTRAGSFDFDNAGNLVSNLNGLHVMGWLADDTGKIDYNMQLQPIKVDWSVSQPPKKTETVTLTGNLDAGLAQNKTITVEKTVYDTQGHPYQLKITFTKGNNPNNPNEWTWSASIIDANGVTKNTPTDTVISFDPDTGKPTSTLSSGTVTYSPVSGGNDITINLNFSGMTQYAAETTAAVQSQDGYPSGTLDTLTIDQAGNIVGVFSNGTSRILAQIALERFVNPAGLVKEGNSLFSKSSNAEPVGAKPPGSSGFGTVKPGTLEMSNVDLSSEFTDMITTQRGFQANSRVITASDEMIQDLVNLKR